MVPGLCGRVRSAFRETVLLSAKCASNTIVSPLLAYKQVTDNVEDVEISRTTGGRGGGVSLHKKNSCLIDINVEKMIQKIV